MATSRLSTRRVEWRVQVGTSNKPGQGLVIFEASVSYIPDPLAAGGPRTAIPEPVAAVLDAGGYACTPDPANPAKAGERGVALFTTDSLGEDGGDWTWTARPQLRSVNGIQMSDAVPAFSFFVPTGTDSLDLAKVQKVPASPGLGTEAAVALVAAAQQAVEDMKEGAAEAVAEAAEPVLTRLLNESPRIPTIEDAEDVIAVVVDALRQHTWLAARGKDGGPTDHSLKLLLQRIDETNRLPLMAPAPGLIGALFDGNGLQTWLAARSKDGGPTDHAVKLIASRLADVGFNPGAGAPEPLVLDGVFDSASEDVVPAFPNMKSVSGWGSSSLNLWAPKFTSYFGAAGAAYFNGATPGEMIEHICARLGSHPAELVFPGDTIPASGSVAVAAINMIPGVTMRTFTGTVAGVRGALSSTAATLTFTRTSAGAAVPVPTGSEFIPDVGPAHRADVVVFEMGKNNLTGTAGRDALVNRMFDEAVAWLIPKVKRVLVLGAFVNRNATAAAKAQVLAVNAHRRARYSNLYVDVQTYVTGSQVWADSGITPTENDLAQQARGEKPDSLSLDDAHLNAAGEAAVFALFAAKLNSLNWF